jgi:hypothetical protein
VNENNTTSTNPLPTGQPTTTSDAGSRKVIQGTARTKKKSELQKAAGSFVSSDIRSVGSYALSSIVIPAIKNTIVSVIKDGIEMLFFGEAKRSSSSSTGARVPGAFVDYSSRFSDRRDDRGYENTRRADYDYTDIVFDKQEQAEAVIDAMSDTLARYGFVTILDLFEFAGLTAPPYTKTRYGWDSIRYAEVRRTRDGLYYIDLPRPRPRD